MQTIRKCLKSFCIRSVLEIIVYMVLCSVYLPVPIAEAVLSIRLVEPDLATRITRGPEWKIYLDGIIDDRGGDKLEREITAKNVESAIVYLNSPGGNLLAGMKLGYLFRKVGFSSIIGKATKTTIPGSRDEPGECYSACVFAFIGGYFRYMDNASTIGVHRFAKAKVSPADLDTAQIVSAAIISYLTEMGVDVTLFELMSGAGQDEIRIVSRKLAKAYRVVNNGFQPASWSIEAVKEGLYLRGIQEAWYGTGKALFYCGQEGQLFFSAMYEAGVNAQAIIAGSIRHSFRIGDDFLPLEKAVHPLLESNGYVIGTFVLPREYMSLLSKSEVVGYAAHPPNPNLFWGFTVEIGDTRGKIDNFIKACKDTAVRLC